MTTTLCVYFFIVFEIAAYYSKIAIFLFHVYMTTMLIVTSLHVRSAVKSSESVA